MGTGVKICGLRRLEDALLAIELGADALGFILVPDTKRYIEPDALRELTAALPPEVPRVGVVIDESPERVCELMEYCRLDIVQLHGSETPETARAIGLDRVWKMIPLNGPEDVARAVDFPAAAILADAVVGNQRGGTGTTCDWGLAAQLAARRRTVLAGGLNPDNVAEAIAAVRPALVDVSSGVEASPGTKDPGKLRHFIRSVRSVGCD